MRDGYAPEFLYVILLLTMITIDCSRLAGRYTLSVGLQQTRTQMMASLSYRRIVMGHSFHVHTDRKLQ